MKRLKEQPVESVDLEHVPNSDGPQRLRRAIALVLRAAQRARGDAVSQNEGEGKEGGRRED